MAAVDKELIEALAANRSQVVQLEATYAAKIAAMEKPHREQLEVLLKERQPLMDAIGWGAFLTGSDSPVLDLLNNTIDPKIMRAITSLKIVTSVEGEQLKRKLIITLGPNIFCSNAELMREIDSEGKTIALTPINWKVPERSRAGSLFSTLFESGTADLKAFDAVDEAYQNPLECGADL